MPKEDVMTSKLDEIAARAELAQGAWEDFQLGIATTRFALEEANNSAEDVKPMLAALRAVEAVHRKSYAPHQRGLDEPSVFICVQCLDQWPCPTIRAIREALG